MYHPFNWRGWVDWGCGALGDMGAHLLDHAYWALDLGYPTSIETVSTPWEKACFPMATKTYYEFPARGSKPPVKLTWYNGGMFPPTPPEFAEGEKLNGEGGAIMVGTKGKVIYDTYGLKSRLLPDSLQKSVGDPPQTLPRITTSHEVNWSNACKGDRRGVDAVRVRGEADRGDAAGRGGATRRNEDPLRRRRDARHQLARGPTICSSASTAARA